MGWENVPFGRANYSRSTYDGAPIALRNRFFEDDPTSRNEPTALLARPGTSLSELFGEGPLRAVFTQNGFMGSDIFVVSDDGLIRSDGTTQTTISGAIAGSNPVSITYQDGPGYSRLWLADGADLFYYEGEGKAQETLTATANFSAGEQVRIDEFYYEFVASGVDAGSPDGSSSDPWLVLIGATLEGSLTNLANAIDGTGTPGSDYSTALTAHATCQVRRVTATFLAVEAQTAGAAGNAFETTETCAAAAFGDTTMSGGGTHVLVAVDVPEDDPNPGLAVSVTTLAAYVIVTVSGSQRMYFIRPGEFWVELFASAETEPDTIISAKAVGDLLAVLGKSTLEWWSATGDDDIPFKPVQGRTLRYGVTPFTDVVVRDELVYVDEKGVVRLGSGERISDHVVEEAIRLARDL